MATNDGGVTNARGLGKALGDRDQQDIERMDGARAHTRIPLIYIAGPLAGATNYDVQQNVIRAEAIALVVAQAGGLGVCPHTMNRNFFGQLTEEFWFAAVLELLTRCDGLVLTPDWERSTGARAAFAWAVKHTLPYMVYFSGHEGAALMRMERWIAGILEGKPAGSLIPGV